GRPLESSQDWRRTMYSPLPRLCRSWAMSSLVLGRVLTTVAAGCEAPDFTDRQPPSRSWPEGSWSDSSSLMLPGVPLFVGPLQLPPLVLSAVGRSMVPKAPGDVS